MENNSKELFKLEADLESLIALETAEQIQFTATYKVKTRDGKTHLLLCSNSIPISKLD